MKICKRCSRDSDEYGMVTLTLGEKEAPIVLCNECHNEYMADMLDVANTDGFNKELIFLDCRNVAHTFKIIKRINPVGVQWEAVEFLAENKIGYLFQTHQDFEEEDNAALERLYSKIKNGLSQRFIEKEVSFGREYFQFKNDRAEGRPEGDEDYEGNIPK